MLNFIHEIQVGWGGPHTRRDSGFFRPLSGLQKVFYEQAGRVASSSSGDCSLS